MKKIISLILVVSMLGTSIVSVLAYGDEKSVVSNDTVESNKVEHHESAEEKNEYYRLWIEAKKLGFKMEKEYETLCSIYNEISLSGNNDEIQKLKEKAKVSEESYSKLEKEYYEILSKLLSEKNIEYNDNDYNIYLNMYKEDLKSKISKAKTFYEEKLLTECSAESLKAYEDEINKLESEYLMVDMANKSEKEEKSPEQENITKAYPEIDALTEKYKQYNNYYKQNESVLTYGKDESAKAFVKDLGMARDYIKSKCVELKLVAKDLADKEKKYNEIKESYEKGTNPNPEELGKIKLEVEKLHKDYDQNVCEAKQAGTILDNYISYRSGFESEFQKQCAFLEKGFTSKAKEARKNVAIYKDLYNQTKRELIKFIDPKSTTPIAKRIEKIDKQEKIVSIVKMIGSAIVGAGLITVAAIFGVKFADTTRYLPNGTKVEIIGNSCKITKK